METEFGNVDGGTGGKVAEWGTDGDKGMCQAEPTKRGKAEQERNHECGKAEQGRMGTECGNVDGETSGKSPSCNVRIKNLKSSVKKPSAKISKNLQISHHMTTLRIP
jgi:hypothetical protein